jgi:dihydrofolate reductase
MTPERPVLSLSKQVEGHALSVVEGFSVVVAMDQNRGIGLKGRMPWKLSGDMRFFRDLTTCPDRNAVEQRYGLVPDRSRVEIPVPVEDLFARLKAGPILPTPDPDGRNAVLMGRKTWESLPAAFKPLPNRLNVVLSRVGASHEEGAHRVWPSLREAVASLGRDESIRGIFVIGGAQIYQEAVAWPECERLYLTDIKGSYSCDVFFPEITSGFREAAATDWIEEAGVRYRFRRLQRDLKQVPIQSI